MLYDRGSIPDCGGALPLWEGGLFFFLRAQLAAACRHVDSPALANRAGQPRRLQNLLEPARRLGCRGGAAVALRGVERDQVHMGVDPGKQDGQPLRLGRGIVGPGDQRPLEKNASARFFALGAAGGD